jgi:hypothetical protein
MPEQPRFEAGFSDIEVTPTFGYYSVVTGREPG